MTSSEGLLHCGVSLIGLSPRHFAEVSAAAEAAGFDSIWLPDHLVYPVDIPAQYPYSESGESGFPATTALFDPWISLAYVACATKRVRLSTHVYVLPLRPLFVTARTLVTLDRLSNGRVTLGAGVGWLQTEYEVSHQEFHNRGKRADELIPLLRRLWEEPVVEHHGEYYDFAPVAFEPKPVQKPSIPIHIGGSSPSALRRAGRLGDGYIDIGATSVAVVAERCASIRFHREDAGRSEVPFEVTVGADLFADPRQHRELRDLGVSRILTNLWMKDPDQIGSVTNAISFIEDFARRREEWGFAAP